MRNKIITQDVASHIFNQKKSPLYKIFRYFFPKKWRGNEYYVVEWKERIAALAQMIKDETSVLDLGCGMQWLREMIPDQMIYYPVDLNPIEKNVIVCDFNKMQFPDIYADLAFISGCIEYINDVSWFVESVSKRCKCVICSYCSIEKHPDIKTRRNYMWVNHLTKSEIINIFLSNNMVLTKDISSEGSDYFRFDKKHLGHD